MMSDTPSEYGAGRSPTKVKSCIYRPWSERQSIHGTFGTNVLLLAFNTDPLDIAGVYWVLVVIDFRRKASESLRNGHIQFFISC